MMRSRLGAHLAGLLAAAAMPLTADDLARLSGGRRVAELLPPASVPGIVVDESGLRLDGPDAVARVVRNLRLGPLAPGLERTERTRERALAPFRATLLAAAESARTDGGWESAPAFLLSPAFPRTMYERPAERGALRAMLTDAGRRDALARTDPAEPLRQARDAASHLARTALTPADLQDLAALLVGAAQLEPAGGAVPRRLPPVFALLGDTERAVLLAEQVRTEPEIELAYVAQAAAQAGDPDATALAVHAAEGLVDDTAPGALLRTAQAIAGCALHAATPGEAHRLAQLARVLVRRGVTSPPQPDAVRGIRQQLFHAARDHEQAIAATTLATAAVALAQSGDEAAGRHAASDAVALGSSLASAGTRAATLAGVAGRLRARTSGVLERVANEAAEAAVAGAGTDLTTLAEVVRVLSGRVEPDGDWTATPAVPDTTRAAAAARTIVDLVLDDGSAPGRGVLAAAAGARHGDELIRAAAAETARRVRNARHATSLERRTRARTEAVVLAEAAVVLSDAGESEPARAAARAALDACGRVPEAARARPLADVAAALLPAADAELFALGVSAAEAEGGVTSGRWDAAAATVVAAAATRALRSGAARLRTAVLVGIRDRAELALRRHEAAGPLTTLADRAARDGDTDRARELAETARRAAHAADPLRRRRAEKAVAAVRAVVDGGMPVTAAADLGQLPSVPALARAWLAEGYPLTALPALAAAEPGVASRIAALVAAELRR